jgi:hypothetical protein
MLNELADADIAICEILHSYSGWVVPSRNGSGLLDRATGLRSCDQVRDVPRKVARNGWYGFNKQSWVTRLVGMRRYLVHTHRRRKVSAPESFASSSLSKRQSACWRSAKRRSVRTTPTWAMRSGTLAASHCPTIPPMDSPHQLAFLMPRTSNIASTSRPSRSMLSGPAGTPERPWPRGSYRKKR